MNWVPVTKISDIPTQTRVLLTVQSLKFEKLDAVMSAISSEKNEGYEVKFHTSDVIMNDISIDMFDDNGEYADTLIITAYMNYPEPYRPEKKYGKCNSCGVSIREVTRCPFEYRRDYEDCYSCEEYTD